MKALQIFPAAKIFQPLDRVRIAAFHEEVKE
jgi:hypothetical protein